jgi:hypothetical protein
MIGTYRDVAEDMDRISVEGNIASVLIFSEGISLLC